MVVLLADLDHSLAVVITLDPIVSRRELESRELSEGNSAAVFCTELFVGLGPHTKRLELITVIEPKKAVSDIKTQQFEPEVERALYHLCDGRYEPFGPVFCGVTRRLVVALDSPSKHLEVWYKDCPQFSGEMFRIRGKASLQAVLVFQNLNVSVSGDAPAYTMSALHNCRGRSLDDLPFSSYSDKIDETTAPTSPESSSSFLNTFIDATRRFKTCWYRKADTREVVTSYVEN